MNLSKQELIYIRNSLLSSRMYKGAKLPHNAVIWEEWMKMDVEDQEKFLWNGVRLMKEFHQFVVKSKLEKDSSLKEGGVWVGDGVKWEMMFQLMETMM